MANTPNLPLAAGNELSTTLASSLTNVATSISLNDGTGFNATGGYIIIDKDVSGKEEVVYYESRTSDTLTVATNGRGRCGTTAVAHDSGASVEDILVDEHVNGIAAEFRIEHSDAGLHTSLSSAIALSGNTINSSNKILDQSSSNSLSATQISSTNKIADQKTVGDAWNEVSDTYTYASATTITVPTDATAKYAVGDWIRLKQSGGTYKYFKLTVVAATLLTINVNLGYTLANEAITAPAFSKVPQPLGAPVANTYKYLTNITNNTAITTGDVTLTSYTVVNAGTYMIMAQISVDNGQAQDTGERAVSLQIKKGATTLGRTQQAVPNITASNPEFGTLTCIVPNVVLAAADVINILTNASANTVTRVKNSTADTGTSFVIIQQLDAFNVS